MSAASERVKVWNRANPERARAITFRYNNGVDLSELPPYPETGKCELCGFLPPNKKLHWDHNHGLEELGEPLKYCHRGWVCYGCNSMFGRIEKIGLRKVYNYLAHKREF